METSAPAISHRNSIKLTMHVKEVLGECCIHQEAEFLPVRSDMLNHMVTRHTAYLGSNVTSPATGTRDVGTGTALTSTYSPSRAQHPSSVFRPSPTTTEVQRCRVHRSRFIVTCTCYHSIRAEEWFIVQAETGTWWPTSTIVCNFIAIASPSLPSSQQLICILLVSKILQPKKRKVITCTGHIKGLGMRSIAFRSCPVARSWKPTVISSQAFLSDPAHTCLLRGGPIMIAQGLIMIAHGLIRMWVE
jgi:hypothetical protein